MAERIGLFNPEDDPFQLVFNQGRSRFNALTGALEFVNPETGLLDFSFDPAKNQSTFGGQTFSGRFDPAILASLTDEDFASAEKKFADQINEEGDILDKSPFGKAAEQQAAIAGSKFNALVFADAFDQARKRFEGPDTFEQLGSFFDPSLQRVRDNPNLAPEIREPLIAEALRKIEQDRQAPLEDTKFNFLRNDSLPTNVREAILADLVAKGEGPKDPSQIPPEFRTDTVTTPEFTDEQLNQQLDVDANRNFSLQAFSNARDRILEGNFTPQERERRLNLLRQRFDPTAEPTISGTEPEKPSLAASLVGSPNAQSSVQENVQPQSLFSSDFEKQLLGEFQSFGKSFLDLFAQPQKQPSLVDAFKTSEKAFRSSGSNIIQPFQSNIGPVSPFGVFAPDKFNQQTGEFSGKT